MTSKTKLGLENLVTEELMIIVVHENIGCRLKTYDVNIERYD